MPRARVAAPASPQGSPDLAQGRAPVTGARLMRDDEEDDEEQHVQRWVRLFHVPSPSPEVLHLAKRTADDEEDDEQQHLQRLGPFFRVPSPSPAVLLLERREVCVSLDEAVGQYLVVAENQIVSKLFQSSTFGCGAFTDKGKAKASTSPLSTVKDFSPLLTSKSKL